MTAKGNNEISVRVLYVATRERELLFIYFFFLFSLSTWRSKNNISHSTSLGRRKKIALESVGIEGNVFTLPWVLSVFFHFSFFFQLRRFSGSLSRVAAFLLMLPRALKKSRCSRRTANYALVTFRCYLRIVCSRVCVCGCACFFNVECYFASHTRTW